MKKIFTILCLCCATVLFMTSCGGGSKSGSSEEKTESSKKISDAVCVTAEENTVVLLTHPSSCKVENTDQGCLVTFKTKAGKQAFLIPYKVNLNYYDGYTVNGGYERLSFVPGNAFKKVPGFHTDGKVRPYDGKGIAFKLPNGKRLAFVGVYLYDKDDIDHVYTKGLLLNMPILSAEGKTEKLTILSANLTLALGLDEILTPTYLTESDQLAVPTDIQKLVADEKIEDCRVFNF